MKTYYFVTNINCENSIRTLMLFFEMNPAIKSWSVDTDTIDNILSIETTELSIDDVILIVEKAGFKISLLKEE